MREDDEDWHHEDDDADEPETGPCPECGELVYDFGEKCPACGYWLTGADRRRIWRSESVPVWVKVAAVLVLVALILGILAFAPVGF